MFGKDLSPRSLKLAVWSSTAIFTVLAVLYFLPVALPFKISYPLATVALFSLWLVPRTMSLAFFASAAGDFMGAAGNFIAQMECFAVAHLFISIFFIQRILDAGNRSSKPFSAIFTKRRLAYAAVSGCGVLFVMLAAVVTVIPETPAGIVRTGVAGYIFIISLMLFSALQQRSVMYAAGAVLFVFSDFILAWNKFVEPLEYERYLIMVPYYLAQWTLFVRSTKYGICGSLLRARL